MNDMLLKLYAMRNTLEDTMESLVGTRKAIDVQQAYVFKGKNKEEKYRKAIDLSWAISSMDSVINYLESYSRKNLTDMV